MIWHVLALFFGNVPLDIWIEYFSIAIEKMVYSFYKLNLLFAFSSNKIKTNIMNICYITI